MTVSLPAHVASHKGDALRRYFWAVEIAATGAPSAVLRVTDADRDLTFNSATWTAGRPLRIVGLSSDPSGNVSIGNGDGALASLGLSWRGDYAHPAVTLWEVWVDDAATVLASYRLAVGRLEAPAWDSEWLHFRLAAAENPEQMTALAQAWGVGRCTYRSFKGPECGYAGATSSCDRSPTACAGMAGGSNLARFGGRTGTYYDSLPNPGDTIDLWNNHYTYVARQEEV